MEDTEKRFLAEFIYESDAIEEIRDDLKLLEGQIARGKYDGHVGAMLLLESLAWSEVGYSVDKKLVCRIQGLITAEQHKKPGGRKLHREWVGRYRKMDVWINGRKCLDPESIPRAMDDLLQEIRQWQEIAKTQSLEENVRNVADFHFRFERIHPFADGNGRTGRALVWHLFKCANIKPFIFTNNDKRKTYYLCFGEREAMRRYFLEKMRFDIQTLPVR